MSYIINNSRGNVIAVIADGTVNTTATDLSLVGRGLTDYGTYENENYVYLLENFANSAAPLQPILGQLWYNSATDVISGYSSANTWVALATQDYVQAQKISPAFAGVPTAPTAPTATANTQIATTAFVTNSPALAGVPTAPTATAGIATTQIATTAFVTNSPIFTGTPTAPTAGAGTNNTQIATTAFVTSGPAFANIPTAPTPSTVDSSNNLATTAFVQAQKANPVFTGTPVAPTAPAGTDSTQIATTSFVQGEKTSPAFTGVPTSPTASLGTSNTQIATTRFVTDWTNALPTMSQQNSNAVAISGGTITGITPLAISDGGTGSSTAAQARSGLQLGNIAIMNTSNIAFTAGTIDNIVITGGNVSGLNVPLAVVSGGTGANTAGTARTNLGLGTLAIQNASSVSITGGAISGLSAPLEISSGGTNATTVSDARTNLGLGSIATQAANAVGITGGTISGLALLSASNVAISSGTITGITDIAVADGGTGASNPTDARTNLGAAHSGTNIIAGAGLIGGGPLNSDVTLAIATNSNGFGTRYVSTGAPTGGNNGDIWYQI
jgi:hypothetical protein